MAEKSEVPTQTMHRETRNKEIDFKALLGGRNKNISKADSDDLTLKQKQKLLKNNAKKHLEYNETNVEDFHKNLIFGNFHDSKSFETDSGSDISDILNYSISDTEVTTVRKQSGMSGKSDSESSLSQLPSSPDSLQNTQNSTVKHDDNNNNDELLDSSVSEQVDSPALSKIEIDLHVNEDEFNTPIKEPKKVTGKANKTKKVKLSDETQAKMELEKRLKQQADQLEYEIKTNKRLDTNIQKLQDKILNLSQEQRGKTKKSKRLKTSPRKLKKLKKKQLEFVKQSEKTESNDTLVKALKSVGIAIKATEINSFVDMAKEFNRRQQSIKKQLASAIYSSSSSSETSDSESGESGKEAKAKPRRGSRRNRNRSPVGSPSQSPIRRKRRISSSGRGSTSDSSDDEKSRSRGKRNSRKLRSGITEKPKDADVTIKLKWATSMLDSKESVDFDDLAFDQYVFGETCILNKKGIDKKEKETRTYLMKRISKLIPKFGFSKAKELYREVLQSIEKGEFAWDDWYKIQRIENEIKFDHVRIEDTIFEKLNPNAVKNIKPTAKLPEKVWCKAFNKGNCTFQTHHKGKFNGQEVKVWHICRVCYSKDKSVKMHRENSDECCYKQE